jgi:hypothetical protein
MADIFYSYVNSILGTTCPSVYHKSIISSDLQHNHGACEGDMNNICRINILIHKKHINMLKRLAKDRNLDSRSELLREIIEQAFAVITKK